MDKGKGSSSSSGNGNGNHDGDTSAATASTWRNWLFSTNEQGGTATALPGTSLSNGRKTGRKKSLSLSLSKSVDYYTRSMGSSSLSGAKSSYNGHTASPSDNDQDSESDGGSTSDGDGASSEASTSARGIPREERQHAEMEAEGLLWEAQVSVSPHTFVVPKETETHPDGSYLPRIQISDAQTPKSCKIPEPRRLPLSRKVSDGASPQARVYIY